MQRFVEVKRILKSKRFFQRDVEIDVLAETISSYAWQYGPRLNQEIWAAMLKNLSVVLDVINDQQAREEFSSPEKILRCVEWFETDLHSSLGTPRQRVSDRRRDSERRRADRRYHDGTYKDGRERRLSLRRKQDDRRDRASRRDRPELL
ncbi:MAG: hypothetical protein V2A56_01455 [bacterium]